MRVKFLVWPLIVLALLSFSWAQDSEKKPKGGVNTPPAGQADEPSPAHDFKLKAEDKARQNPQKFTTVSVERGKKIFTTQCAMCHGDKGDGNGDLAAEMKTALPDFTKVETLEKYTDGELFAMIGNGSFPMPAQGERMKDYRKWQLVNYLRSLSGKVPEKSTGTEPEEGILLIPQ